MNSSREDKLLSGHGSKWMSQKPQFQPRDLPELQRDPGASHHSTRSPQVSVPDKGIELGRDRVTHEPGSFPKLQPHELLVLQLADNAVVDGQPVNVGNE